MTDLLNCCNGGLSSLVRSRMICRPRRQVDISMNAMAPISSGNQPPCGS